MLLASCATRDPVVEGVVGSEPQRLSFGPPSEVRTSFLQKIKACWISSPNAPLAGYKLDMGEQPGSEGRGGEPSNGYYGVLISNASAPAESLEIQFHKYNENTLIVTRNVSLAPVLMDRLKRDLQLWALTGTECGGL